MTEQPGNYHLGKKADLGDAVAWMDTLINAHEADVEEVLENCLHYLFQEGEATIPQDELLMRIRGALARIKGQVVNKEIELRVNDDY